MSSIRSTHTMIITKRSVIFRVMFWSGAGGGRVGILWWGGGRVGILW